MTQGTTWTPNRTLAAKLVTGQTVKDLQDALDVALVDLLELNLDWNGYLTVKDVRLIVRPESGQLVAMILYRMDWGEDWVGFDERPADCDPALV